MVVGPATASGKMLGKSSVGTGVGFVKAGSFHHK
jgi:hypothetical protein